MPSELCPLSFAKPRGAASLAARESLARPSSLPLQRSQSRLHFRIHVDRTDAALRGVLLPGGPLPAHRLEPRLHVVVKLGLGLLALALLLLLRRPRGVRVGPPDGASVDPVARDAADAAGCHARHDLPCPLRQGHAADGRRAEVRPSPLDGAHGAEDLVARLPPLGDEGGVDHLLPHHELVALARDLPLLVVQIVHKPVLLVVNAVDRPGALALALPFVGVVDRLAEPLLELQEGGFD
mmetsp:Transcript_22579/g.47826  ORF Transcript_22579/g.47826 Transcript_22579/m.47826 type:complete len:238 (+) Transcript_22579:301-1014(+)